MNIQSLLRKIAAFEKLANAFSSQLTQQIIDIISEKINLWGSDNQMRLTGALGMAARDNTVYFYLKNYKNIMVNTSLSMYIDANAAKKSLYEAFRFQFVVGNCYGESNGQYIALPQPIAAIIKAEINDLGAASKISKYVKDSIYLELKEQIVRELSNLSNVVGPISSQVSITVPVPTIPEVS